MVCWAACWATARADWVAAANLQTWSIRWPQGWWNGGRPSHGRPTALGHSSSSSSRQRRQLTVAQRQLTVGATTCRWRLHHQLPQFFVPCFAAARNACWAAAPIVSPSRCRLAGPMTTSFPPSMRTLHPQPQPQLASPVHPSSSLDALRNNHSTSPGGGAPLRREPRAAGPARPQQPTRAAAGAATFCATTRLALAKFSSLSE